MNPYGLKAKNYMFEYCPHQFRTIEDKEAYFTQIGEEAERQVSSIYSKLSRPELGEKDLAPPGQVAKVNANLAALRVLRELQAGSRSPAAFEQNTLARWASWGAIPEVFDEANPRFGPTRAELHALLSEQEWAAARRTTINAHYTSAEVVQAVWSVVADLGFVGGRVLE